MNTPKTLVVGLLFAGAFLAPGFAASHRRAVLEKPIRCDQTAPIDPAVMSQVARAEAFVALSQSSGAGDRLPFGF